MDAMASIRTTFFQECDEQLVELESGLLAIQEGSSDGETINCVFRAVHSIKGGAGAFQLDELVAFAHVFENLLDLLRTHQLEASPALLALMLRATDTLADIVKAGRDGAEYDVARTAEIASELKEKASGPGGAAAVVEEQPLVFEPIAIDFASFDDLSEPYVPENIYSVSFAPRASLYANGGDAAILLRELGTLGKMTVATKFAALPSLEAMDPAESYLSFKIEIDTAKGESAIIEIFDFAAWDSDLAIGPKGAEAEEEVEEVEPEPLPAAEVTVASAQPHVDDHPKPAQAVASQLPVVTPPEASRTARNAEAGEQGKGAAAPTIRVDLERVDRLIDLVGELVINQAMLAERVDVLALPRMSPVSIALDELENLTREIQDSVMAIRAQPVRSVFQRLPRLVREVAAQTGKSVRLETVGEGTEVDKTVVERLVDPLTHMIRNAIDHGVEKPEKRIAAGKDPEGYLRVSAAHRSGRIVIEIADDGAGINRERVREIAVNKNLIAADANLSDEETDNLIFLPGFSTAATITDISGRGVGMDVVRRSIQALGGRISITSTPGRGSTFTLSLPLTLAVLDGMVVTAADETFVVPLSAVVEILMPQTMTVHGFGRAAKVVGLRGEFVPLIDIGQRLGRRTESVDASRGVTLLVEAEGGARSALIVDAIQGQRQVVIKSLESNYGAVRGIAAATILGNGRVALILDVDALVESADGRNALPLPKAV